jgi:hypothetical protein
MTTDLGPETSDSPPGLGRRTDIAIGEPFPMLAPTASLGGRRQLPPDC